MITSMTGYGVARHEDADLSLAIEVRSVNNRYLKLLVKVPDFLSGLEADLERVARRSMSRGAVTVTVHARLLGGLVRPPINEAVLVAYATELRRLAERLDLDGRLSVADLAQLPGVLAEDEPAADLGPIRQRAVATLEAALEDFKAMRIQEGRALEADLRGHVEAVKAALDAVRSLVPSVVEEYRNRLLDRVSVLLKESPVELAAESLLSEVSLFAERSDISEEVARLASHLVQFDELLDVDQPAGRKLEFVTQEMLREANTMGAKSGHAEIGRRVVDIKAAIDRMKEQVQNVE